MPALEALTSTSVSVKQPEHFVVGGIIFQSGIDEWTPRQLKCVVWAAIHNDFALLFEEDNRGGVRLTVMGQSERAMDFLKLTNDFINNPHLFPLEY